MNKTYPKKNVLRTCLLLLLGGAIAFGLLVWFYQHNGQNRIADFLLSMCGTFFGAFFAFKLNEDKEARKLAQEQRAALNRALFVIGRQYDVVLLMKRELSPYKLSFDKAFNLPALTFPSFENLVQNLRDLEFLLDSGHPNILNELIVEDDRFRSVLDSIKMRNDFYVHIVQPKIESLNLNGAQMTFDLAKSALGDRIFSQAMTYSEKLYYFVDLDIDSKKIMLDKLYQLARQLFPGEGFIKFHPIKKSVDPNSHS